MKLTLSEPLSERVAALAANHGFDDVERYIETLLDHASPPSLDRLEELLIEGLDSGDPIEVTPEFWAEHKRRFLERFPDAAPFV